MKKLFTKVRKTKYQRYLSRNELYKIEQHRKC